MAEEITEELIEKKERKLRRIFIYFSVFCLILMIVVIPVSIYLIKVIPNPGNSTTVITSSMFQNNPVYKLKENEVENYFTIFSSSSTKCSNCLMPNFQNSGSATLRSRSSPISLGDKLLPDASAFLNLGTNFLPSCRYF